MYMMIKLIAHAGEEHTTFSNGIDHWLSSTLNIFMLWLFVTGVLIVLLRALPKIRPGNKLLIAAAFQLIFGLATYRSSPAFASLIVSLGFMSVIIVTLFSLQREDN